MRNITLPAKTFNSKAWPNTRSARSLYTELRVKTSIFYSISIIVSFCALNNNVVNKATRDCAMGNVCSNIIYRYTICLCPGSY